MTEYFVTFTAYIDERKRPENFPKKIHSLAIVQADTVDQLVKNVNNLLVEAIVKNQGMAVPIEIAKMEKVGQLDFSNRMWVPLHMITHIVPSINIITPESVALPGMEITETPLPGGANQTIQ